MKGLATLKSDAIVGPIPTTMKAAVAEKHGGKLIVKDIPVPEVGPGQVLVKIHSSGVCHTDVHVVDGDWPVKSILPIIPGHEGAGIVVKVASNVTNVKVGDRVGVPWLHSACGECEFCTSGWETLCLKATCTGFSAQGCFSEYVVAPGSHVSPIPDAVSFEQAARKCFASKKM